MEREWLTFVLNVNPEPWAIGPVGYARRGGRMSAYVGRNAQLDAYKQSVKEAIVYDAPPMTGEIELEFMFWRHRAEYTTPQARSHRKHQADLTNLVKATEDALQGVLFANDKDTQRSIAEIREQSGTLAHPMVIVRIRPYVQEPLPVWLLNQIADDYKEAVQPPSDNTWRGPDEEDF